MTNATLTRGAQGDLERARADYLAVSRSGHVYSSEAEHLRAERIAWERLERALAVVREASRTQQSERVASDVRSPEGTGPAVGGR